MQDLNDLYYFAKVVEAGGFQHGRDMAPVGRAMARHALSLVEVVNRPGIVHGDDIRSTI